MSRKSLTLVVLCVVAVLTIAAARTRSSSHINQDPQSAQAAAKPTPADGYNVHVLAPHLVDGHQMGPYHHYCKVMAPDPQIVCLIYDTTDATARLSQVEWIYAKKLTRNQVSRVNWNKNWHDHAVEIAGGRVQVLDMPPDKAKEVADLVSTTDGMIYHFYFDGTLPNGKMSIAQAVGHKPLSAAELKNFEDKK